RCAVGRAGERGAGDDCRSLGGAVSGVDRSAPGAGRGLAGGNVVMTGTGAGPAPESTRAQGHRYDRPIFGGGSPASEAPARPARRRKRLGLQGQLLLFMVLVLAGLGAAALFYLRPSEAVYVLDVYQY